MKIDEKKTIIFDYGGVICTSRSLQFMQWAEQEYKVAQEAIMAVFNSEPWDRYNTGRASSEECYQMIQKAGVPLSCPELKRKLASFSKPAPEMAEIITKLKKQGFDLAILSNSHPELTEVVREYFPGTFRVEVFSEEAGVRKPYPEIYELALKKIGKEAGYCFFVDDKEENLAYPRKRGMQVHCFESIPAFVNALGCLRNETGEMELWR